MNLTAAMRGDSDFGITRDKPGPKVGAEDTAKNRVDEQDPTSTVACCRIRAQWLSPLQKLKALHKPPVKSFTPKPSKLMLVMKSPPEMRSMLHVRCGLRPPK